MSTGLTVGLLINLGGIGGGVVAGLVMPRIGLLATGRIALAGMAVAVAALSCWISRTGVAMPLAVAVGFTLWAVQACIYTAMMIAFPVGLRATAIGLVTTAGRVGSALGPMAGGILLSAGLTVFATTLILVIPALLGALLVVDYAKERPGSAGHR